MTKILIPLPSLDFDPSEVAIPSMTFIERGHEVTFATPNGEVSICDQRMIHGEGLGIFKPFMVADQNAQSAYQKLLKSKEFNSPVPYKDIQRDFYDCLYLPGGHASGMRPYLESNVLQNLVVWFFEQQKIIGAVCHGVLLVARSINPDTNKSILYQRKTTGLLRKQERLAYFLTKRNLGTYYLTYPETTVEDEVKSYLENENQFIQGPSPLLRDSFKKLSRGFVCQDGNYLSARWPGDIHLLTENLLKRFSPTA